MLVIRYLAYFFCFTLLIWGCGERQTETPVQPKVITQKITIQKDSGKKPVTGEVSAAQKTPAVATTTGLKPPAEPPVQQAESVPTKPANIPVPEAPKPPKPADAAAKAEATDTKDTEAEEKEPAEKLIAYIPEGKIDPFTPLFREQPLKTEEKAEAGVTTPSGEKAVSKKKKRIPRTPLEKMDLSQLELVGIIRSEKGNKALVQDATGKGYVLNKGTYVGINSGFVVKITKSKVLVEEEVEDLYGNITLRERELVLQKPVGEI